MKRFVIHSSIFLFLSIIILITSTLLINNSLNKKAVFKIDSQVNYIVLGHSHPECAFNDDLISGVANFAESGESYFYTYFKTRKILEQNKYVKTVFIEFTNDQLNSHKDDWIWTDEFLSNKYTKYAPFINLEAHELLISNNTSGFINNLAIGFNKNLSSILQSKLDYTQRIGGYHFLDKQINDSVYKKTLKTKDRNIKSRLPLNNIEYLSKLVSYCIAHGKNVYLIRSPLHQKNLDLKNEKVFQEVLKDKFNNIEFLDFVNFPLSDFEFADLEHLNFKGAEKFSLWFNRLLETGLLEQLNKQAFITEQMHCFDFVK